MASTATKAPKLAKLARNEKATTVGIDTVMGPYPAIIKTDCGWNGWEIPLFTLDVVRQMAEDTAKLVAADPGNRDCYDVVKVKDDGTVVVYSGQWDEEEVIGPDARGLYGVGAFCWTWSEC